MSASKITDWLEENGARGVRFYPANPSESTSDDILSAAHDAIMTLEAGKVVSFKDPFSYLLEEKH